MEESPKEKETEIKIVDGKTIIEIDGIIFSLIINGRKIELDDLGTQK